MIKITKIELKELLKSFNNIGVYIKMNGIISGRITLHKLKCRYNKSDGILELYDKISEDIIKIETFMARTILCSENKKIIQIKLDNEEDITIEL